MESLVDKVTSGKGRYLREHLGYTGDAEDFYGHEDLEEKLQNQHE